ncbi:MAG: hypothetical protein GH156_00585 [Dehalococcoidia bacterium]|nr:hypothetical protein [Dehalococcoidia bacterium]
MVMPIAQYVVLEKEKPKRMLFNRWWWEDRQLTDPKSKRLKTARIMVFHVTQEDGERVDKTFSALAYKLQQSLAPLIETGQIFTRLVEITWYPRDYATEYAVRLI